ncbi:MAG: hypothetical protein FWB95_02370 [Treponema sp.]|nr:hypothetical protein [Treponema sp.]
MIPVKKRAVILIVFALFCLSACGIEDFYYLPQVSEGWVTRNFNTDAEVRVPAGFLSNYYYASGYVIFYRIYLSTIENGLSTNLSEINSTLFSHFRDLETYTDPTKTSSTVETSTFRTRGYYELEIEGANITDTVLSVNGGTFIIKFPTNPGEYPSISFNGNEYRLLRSTGGGAFAPVPSDRYFFNSMEIRDTANAISTVNADVTAITGADNAYVSMYIAAIGRHQRNFSRIYGKPAFISVFKMTNN